MQDTAMQETSVGKKKSASLKTHQRPFSLKKSQLRGFLRSLEENGRAEETIKKYRSDLNRFFDFLGEEKWIYPDSLPRWRESMIADGYAARSINASIVAVNSLYDYLGCWEWQCSDWMELPENDAPELTRQEYLLMLREAKRQENIQLYLLIKIFACTELTPGELPLLTREAVNKGMVSGKKRGGQTQVSLPAVLREDLQRFALFRNIRSGPIFLTAGKKCLPRTVISKQIATLGEEMGLEPGKANPRNLRRLYLKTLSEFQKQADLWVAHQYTSLLEREEKDTPEITLQ